MNPDLLQQRNQNLREKFEFWSLVLLSSSIWSGFVWFLLKWQKFPMKKHKVEVACMFICPCLITVIFLVALDWQLSKGKKKSNQTSEMQRLRCYDHHHSCHWRVSQNINGRNDFTELIMNANRNVRFRPLSFSPYQLSFLEFSSG